MPSSKPTLGYSSRTEAAVALRAEGLSEPAIAEKIGVSRNAIAGLLAKAKDNRQAPQIGRGTSRGNADRLAAKAAGIMLSHEAARPIHRPTSDGAMRVIELKLPEAQFGKLVEMARKAARTPSAYATDLFQAAYSARCAPTGDVALDAQVGRLGTPEVPAGPMIDMMMAELDHVRADLCAALKEAAGWKNEANNATHEMDEQIRKAAEWQAMAASLGSQLETALAGHKDAERRCRLMAQAADETNGKIYALQEALQALGEELGVEPGAERVAGLRAVFVQQAEAIQQLMARVAELKNGHDAHPLDAPNQTESEPPTLTALQFRQAKSLRAAGNSLAEIAAALGVDASLVRQSMGGK
ncbi:MAG: hypothetical protein HEQ16_05125 [Bosea sp.]|jgi:DNA-binding CsgD family transcriptional regulator|nr:hypothetical protein [Bosea sp. (in: a-proteobacteria)]